MSATAKRGRTLINAQTLIGTTVGTCTLQKLLGQGTMGSVFLGQQARPARQVAVKVIAPLSQLADQQPLFLERFRQEIVAVAALKHQNILPIYEYGEHNGLAYLVMPYIGSGTLQDVLAQKGTLSFTKAADYLSQLAAALDFAHSQGVVHRDVRPANVLKMPDGRLLLTDFGLVKMVMDRQASQMRLLQAGIRVGALEYMAPEQVMGDVVDGRTDLYAVGVLLYQMITGKLPFQGSTPVQVATQLMQATPPSPRSARPELSPAAEEALLRAIAKRPADRYESVQEFANEFRLASTTRTSLSIPPGIVAATPPVKVPVEVNRAVPHSPVAALASARTPRSPGSFAPTGQQSLGESRSEEDKRQGAMNTPSPSNHTPLPLRPRQGLRTSQLRSMDTTDDPAAAAKVPISGSGTTVEQDLPAFNFSIVPVFTPAQAGPPATNSEPGHPAFAADAPLTTSAAMRQTPLPEVPAPPLAPSQVTRTLGGVESEQGSTGVVSPAQPAVPNPPSPLPFSQLTGTLVLPGGEQGSVGTVKLASSVKVIQVPVAGQPGRYVTGFLPVLTQTQPSQEAGQPPAEAADDASGKLLKRWQKIIALAMAVLLVLAVSGIVAWQAHTKQDQRAGNTHIATPNVQATAQGQLTATAEANIILSDPLNQNIHNWPVNRSGNKVYIFENGAYHILNNDPQQSVPALLNGVDIKEPMVYTLTMEEIRGDDSSINNSFGMILRFSPPQTGTSHTTFYTFQVVNVRGGEYQFSKYDDIKGPAVNPYNLIWHHAFGREFHQGQGKAAVNTFRIVANGKFFTFFVNGQKVGSTQDSSLPNGEVGMIVNLKGTEVAFSNLLLTYH